MTETEFFVYTNTLLSQIENQLEAANIDVDTSINEGVLEIEFMDASKIIVNRHAVNQEIWVATKSGGFHYQFDGKDWHNTRTGSELFNELAAHISMQAGAFFSFILNG